MPTQSRREFIITAVTGTTAALLPLASARRMTRGATSMLYVGTYTDEGHTDGIHLVELDTASGALRHVAALESGPNPSFLVQHPVSRVLYAVNETPAGAVSAFTIGDDGALTLLGSQSSGGAGPCYVSVDKSGRVALVANYDGGSVAVLPIAAAGDLAIATQIVQHVGRDSASRQAHAHCIITDASNTYALAADLGLDRVLVYRINVDEGALLHLEAGDAQLPDKTGPRHLAWHPRLPLLYLAGETSSTINTLHFEKGVLRIVGSASTLPQGWQGTNYVADVHLSNDGRSLYVSNRGHDSIAVFAVARDGTPTLQQTISCGGNWPRNFGLDLTGEWMLVANQHSDSIAVLRRDPRTGQLSETAQRLAVPKPSCVCFVL